MIAGLHKLRRVDEVFGDAPPSEETRLIDIDERTDLLLQPEC
jgi:hypothetical protein